MSDFCLTLVPAACMQCVALHGELLPPQSLATTAIRFSTHVKHHVFDLIIGFLGKNSCPKLRNLFDTCVCKCYENMQNLR